jgi:hypothetical protein
MSYKYTITFGSRSQHSVGTDDLAGARKIVEALRETHFSPVLVNGVAPHHVWGTYVSWSEPIKSHHTHDVNRGAW